MSNGEVSEFGPTQDILGAQCTVNVTEVEVEQSHI